MTASGFGQVTKQGNGYLFRIKWTEGQTIRYNIESGMASGPGGKPMSMTMGIAMTVADVKAGIATVKTKVTGMGGTPQEVTSKIDSMGKMSGGGSNNPMTNSSNITYPKGPVPVGGSWTENMNMAQGPMGGMKTTTTYRFKGLKNVGGRQFAEIALSVTASGAASMKGSGTVLINMVDGMMHTLDLNSALTMAMPGAEGKPGKPMTINTTTKARRA